MSTTGSNNWAYFTPDELRCKCGCGQLGMDDEAVEAFDLLRFRATQMWGHELPFIVTSGYRCTTHDIAVGGANLHPHGRCIDIAVMDASKRGIILTVAFAHPKIMGVGISDQFLHLDTIPRTWRLVWTY